MGYFRLMLAAIVAFSHVPGRELPLNLGVSAVVAFYFLSGYLMANSYLAFQDKSTHPVRAFYIDRFFRIVPAFWLVFVAALLIRGLTGRAWLNWSTMSEFLLVPYHLTYMFGSTNVLLPTWSLSAEVAFYLLLPLLARFSTRWLLISVIVLLFGQFVVFAVPGNIADALFSGDMASCKQLTTAVFCKRSFADVFGYRWLPFALVYFALGMLTYRQKARGGLIIGLFVAANLAFLLIADGFNWLKHGYVQEELWGAILLLPTALLMLGKFSGPNERWNVLCGKLAYPLFLTHWGVRALASDYLEGPWQGIGMFAMALAAAVLVMLFQDRIDQARYHIRGFGKSTRTLAEDSLAPDSTAR